MLFFVIIRIYRLKKINAFLSDKNNLLSKSNQFLNRRTLMNPVSQKSKAFFIANKLSNSKNQKFNINRPPLKADYDLRTMTIFRIIER